jgi:pSer/pThr/pTyr-binding forkhead associated (FHA) protein
MAAAAAAPAPAFDDDRVGIDRTQVVSAAPAATASAVVRSGADEGRRLALVGSRLTVGRGSSCDLTIADTTVSREHAAFVLRGDTWWVVDLGSTNGTRVNGLRTSEQPLGRGDRIEFGDVVVEMVEG